MKKLLLVPAALFVFACNDADNTENNPESTDAGNVEQHSGENISPQLENEGQNRFTVDTISSSGEAEQESRDDLQ